MAEASPQQKKINRIQVENIMLVLIIISLVVAISINYENISFIRKGEPVPPKEELRIRNKAKWIAWVYIFASIFFLYAAYKDYRETEDPTQFYFVAAAALLVLASVIRTFALYNTADPIEGAEDFAL